MRHLKANRCVLMAALVPLALSCAVSLAASGKRAQPPLPAKHTVKKIERWNIHVDQRLLEGKEEEVEVGRRALRLLEYRLSDIAALMEKSRLEKLREVPIWLDLTHGKLRTMQYHPSAGWLKGNGYTTELAKCVHIPDARRFISAHHQHRQPWCTLHELAHAYHDRVLGFGHEAIKKAWKQAVDSKRYDKVLLINGRTTRHYALTDQKEFFAEMTESYFGVNDFYPFNRAELSRENPETYNLLLDIWGPTPDGPKVK